ncbi:MAG: hypothetical protein KJ607_02350 [Bacteroidetes bacterium]|nr:hypothetical protein [Bacteroidota bacterium]
MSYINTFDIIHYLLQNQKPDSKKLLAEVDRDTVYRALNNSKDGVPRPFLFTNKPIEEKNLSKMKRRDKKHLFSVYEYYRTDPEKALPQFQKLNEKYPNVPCIYNYLYMTYLLLKQEEQLWKVLIETRRRFPDYLFGKISLAEYYLSHNDHRKVPEIFDRKFEIYQHYSADKDIFHISEVRSFYSVVGSYFARAGKTARAIYCYFITEQADPEHPVVRLLGDEIIHMEVIKVKNSLAKKIRRKPEN